jgi:hypothetical protein
LATKYEQDNLDAASQKADQFILLTALAERTTANVVAQREEKLPFAGGIEVPVQTSVATSGNLYFIAGMIEQKSKSYAINKMNPWPVWQVVLGKMFRADTGKVYVIRYLAAERSSVPTSSDDAKTAIKFAMEGLNSEENVHRLASVIAVEKQTLSADQYKKLTQVALDPAPSVEVFYIYFLTSDMQHPAAPASQHAVAVMRTAKELKIVRHAYYGQPGYTVIKGSSVFSNFDHDQFSIKLKDGFRKALSLTVKQGVTADDVQITSVVAAGAAKAARRRLAPAAAGGGGTQVDWSIAVSGSGSGVYQRMQDPRFTTVLAGNLQSSGLTFAKASAMAFQSGLILRNNQHPHENKQVAFVVLTMGAFVLGVLLTAVVGVWGMRRNKQVQLAVAARRQTPGQTSWSATPKYQRVAGLGDGLS